MNAALIIVCLIAANFLHQYLTGKDWDVAFDRSFFQAIAITIYVLYGRATRKP